MKTCLCGKPATHIAYLPVDNVYVGLRQATSPQHVCSYHAIKAEKQGFDVEKLDIR